MKRFSTPVLAALCSIAIISGCSHSKSRFAQVPDLAYLTVTPSMKGWELYSWPEGNSWKFSFLAGTNRVKSLAEVTSSGSTAVLASVTGVDSARMVLNKFPQGEAITLIGQGWLQNAWRGQYGNLRLPPQTIIDQLKAFAVQKGLTFTVAD